MLITSQWRKGDYENCNFLYRLIGKIIHKTARNGQDLMKQNISQIMQKTDVYYLV